MTCKLLGKQFVYFSPFTLLTHWYAIFKECSETNSDFVVKINPLTWTITGEANTDNANVYSCQMKQMISHWRSEFNQQSMGETSLNFPFGYVQVNRTCGIIFFSDLLSFTLDGIQMTIYMSVSPLRFLLLVVFIYIGFTIVIQQLFDDRWTL